MSWRHVAALTVTIGLLAAACGGERGEDAGGDLGGDATATSTTAAMITAAHCGWTSHRIHSGSRRSAMRGTRSVIHDRARVIGLEGERPAAGGWVPA